MDTLALGKDDRAGDAYSTETQQIQSFIAEAESISARKATLLDATEEDETVRVLCRRLFASIDTDKARQVVTTYRALWEANKEALPGSHLDDRRADEFVAGYPLHPELIATLTTKTATLGNFQRVRGMLRLLARTVADLWNTKPADACAVHLHHINLANEAIRQEVVTRLNQQPLVPAIKAEVAAHEGDVPALAQQSDAAHYKGLPPYASYVARTILMHTLAYNDALRGLTREELRYSVLSPGTDLSFIDDARKRFVADSAYLDDRPNVPLRFFAEANLTQIIRVPGAEVRTLNIPWLRIDPDAERMLPLRCAEHFPEDHPRCGIVADIWLPSAHTLLTNWQQLRLFGSLLHIASPLIWAGPYPIWREIVTCTPKLLNMPSTPLTKPLAR